MRSHFKGRPLTARTKVSNLTPGPDGEEEEEEEEMTATQEITEALEEVQTPATHKAWIKNWPVFSTPRTVSDVEQPEVERDSIGGVP